MAATLVNRLLILLDQNPDYARVMERMVEAEEGEVERCQQLPHDAQEWSWINLRSDRLPDHFGVERREIGAPQRVMDALVWEGVLELVYSSRSHAPYRLVDRAETQRALAAWSPETTPAVEDVEIPRDLFTTIYGYEHVKRFITLTLARPRPVHVLLVGDVGTAKTIFLEELRRLPRSCYADGAIATKAGLVEYLLAEEPRYLVIDQMDHLPPQDQHALLGVMATGRVARLKYRAHLDETRLVWVFASANSTRRLSPALMDRFQLFHFEAYSPQEYAEVCRHFLVKREGCEPGLAAHIAKMLAPRTRSVRVAQRLARLADSVSDADELLAVMRPTFHEE